MSRQLIEFIQSQSLSWSDAPSGQGHAGSEWKTLSSDDATGEITALVRLPPGWSAPGPYHLRTHEELFVLDGAMTIGDQSYIRHDYAFLPEGYTRIGAHAKLGAVLMVYYHGAPIRDSGRGDHNPSLLIQRIISTALSWDNANMDPNINHLQAQRKNLRLDPNGKCRTYLLGGMPHGFPPHDRNPKERHPHAEEFFMVSGEMSCTLVGTLRAGAYFYRPGGIWHGLDSSHSGFLLLCRTPGTNATISEWSEETFTIARDPRYQPQVPETLRGVTNNPLPNGITY